jgi:hypothetical protein
MARTYRLHVGMVATTINDINLLAGQPTAKAMMCAVKCMHQEHS